ncbi:MAG: hypothetical protein Q8R60_13185 [Mycobacteriales bacterium]|nr:hypothetical protein [Mycobacteriales bacterium]
MDSVDLRDARAIRLAFEALEQSSQPRSGPTNAVRRWILNNVWFVPRGAYTSPRWSVAASASPERVNITYEHVVPISRVREELLKGPQTDEAYVETMTRLLVMAVVTKEEDRRLSEAGLANKHPQDVITDVWARYQVVNIVMDETDSPVLEPDDDLPALPHSLVVNEELAKEHADEDSLAAWVVDSTVRASAKQNTSASQEASFENGLRNAREAKGFGRIPISVALEMTTTEWWHLENSEPLGTAQHTRTMDLIAALPPFQDDGSPYSNHQCPSCFAQPGAPCRTKDNTPTPKPHGNRTLGGFAK